MQIDYPTIKMHLFREENVNHASASNASFAWHWQLTQVVHVAAKGNASIRSNVQDRLENISPISVFIDSPNPSTHLSQFHSSGLKIVLFLLIGPICERVHLKFKPFSVQIYLAQICARLRFFSDKRWWLANLPPQINLKCMLPNNISLNSKR
jgi:hypothetical protein